ncbi:MAG TPA: hypothetical protein VFW35_08000 [Sphingomicrobium sp.]|nr:hypothetical protein [Sphingomicrobium sp.]
MKKTMFAATGLAAVALMPVAAHAQAADPNQAVKDETARIQAETALENARSDNAKAQAARIEALGLPSFEGKAELGANAGAMEVNLLASRALGAAADKIATDNLGSMILLSSDEVVDFGAADSMKLQMDAIAALYKIAGIKPPSPGGKHGGPAPTAGALPAAIAAFSAVAGLFRSDSTLTGADASAVTQQMLVAAVAAKLAILKHPAVVPAALVSGIPPQGKKLYDDLNDLAELRLIAEQRKAALSAIEKPSAAEKAELAAITAATTRHDAFLAKVMVPDDKGAIPFATAARLAGLLGTDRSVLRVYVNKAGGSIVNTKNIATTFGVDPLKISGGVVVSYVRSTPSTGEITAADVLSCDTTLTSVRSIQERRWINKRPQAIKSALCVSILSPPS